jgi:hypothetical protein
MDEIQKEYLIEENDILLENSYSVDEESCEDSENYTSRVSVDISSALELHPQKQILVEIIEAVIRGDGEFIDEISKNKTEYKECKKHLILNFFKNLVFFQSGPDGVYPIQYAIIYGQIELIEKLINLGENLNKILEGIPSLHLSLSLASRK